MFTHRIRRCNGNRDYWTLVMLFDGKESECAACYRTSPTIDGILQPRTGLHGVNIGPTDRVELVLEAK